jgi:hypothetical protein
MGTVHDGQAAFCCAHHLLGWPRVLGYAGGAQRVPGEPPTDRSHPVRPKTATGILALAIVLTFCLRGSTAPAPSEEQTAKAKLEALEKKLPDFLVENIDKSERWIFRYKSSVRFLRPTGPASAKLAVRLERIEEDGVKSSRFEEALVIHLTYHDGLWTTQRFEGTWTDDPEYKNNNRGAKFLMVALDELAAK